MTYAFSDGLHERVSDLIDVLDSIDNHLNKFILKKNYVEILDRLWLEFQFKIIFFFLLIGLSLPLFLYFCLIYIIQLTDKVLPMLGFELRISGVRSDRSATTTALEKLSSLLRKIGFLGIRQFLSAN